MVMVMQAARKVVDNCFRDGRLKLPPHMTIDRLARQFETSAADIRDINGIEFVGRIEAPNHKALVLGSESCRGSSYFTLDSGAFDSLRSVMTALKHSDMALSESAPKDFVDELLLSRLGVLPKRHFDGVKDVVSLLGRSPATTSEEITEKRARFSQWLEANSADYLVLRDLNVQNWLLGGRDFHEITNTSVAAFLVPRDLSEPIKVFINNIEEPRVTEQEMEKGIGPDWQKHIRLVINGWQEEPDIRSHTIGKDTIGSQAFSGFHELHYSMLPIDVERYEWLAQVASAALTKAGYFVNFGEDSEADVAAQVKRMLAEVGVETDVLLVAADGQIAKTNHPLPRTKEDGGLIDHDVAIVLCARYRGQIANLTRRIVRGRDAYTPIEENFQKCGYAAAAALRMTRPGYTYGKVYETMQQIIRDFGFPEAWRHCHWGGPTGIGIRDKCVSSSSDPFVILPYQAFTWNPILGGVKVEETILTLGSNDGDPRVLTLDPYGVWPTTSFDLIWGGDVPIILPGILVR